MGDKDFPSIFGSASALHAVKPEGRGPAEGVVIAGARLLERLGEGLAGYHYRGELAGARVSVHLLRNGVTEEGRATFQDAVGALLSLPKEGLPPGLRVPLAVDDGRTSVALEVTPDRHLEDLAGPGHPLAARVEAIASVAVLLEALHHRGLSHGALSPTAVFLDTDGEPVIAGAGGTSLLVGTKGDSAEPQAFHNYASPEAKEGTGVDARSDIYSLGRLLHFLLTGTQPPPTDDDPPGLPTLSEQPRGLVRIIRKCTRPQSADRYADVGAFLADLGRNDAPDVGDSPAPGTPEPPGHERIPVPPRFARPAREERQDRNRSEPRGGTRAEARARVAEERALEKARAVAEVELGIRAPGWRPTARFGLGVVGCALFAGAFVAPFLTYPLGTQLAPAVAVIGAALATFVVRGRGPRGAYYELAAAALAAVVVFGADPTSVAVRAAAEARLASEDPEARGVAARFLASHGHRSFVDAELPGAALEELSLDGANFEGADLRGANLTRSDLRGARLHGADVHDADFSGADLTDVELSETGGPSEARCDAATRMPQAWRCTDGRLRPTL